MRNSVATTFRALKLQLSLVNIERALIAARRGKPDFGSLLLGAGVFRIGCTLAAFSPGYWWFAATLAVIGVAALTFTNAMNSMMYLSTKPSIRSRSWRLVWAWRSAELSLRISWSLGIQYLPELVSSASRGFRIPRRPCRSPDDAKPLAAPP